MRHLFLFRHAEAVPVSKFSDRERPLTADGRQAATRVGAFLALTRQKIDLVLVSDAARTQETWKLAQAEFGEAPEVRIEKDLYNAGRGDVMEEVRDLPDSAQAAMIVGHNPAISEFASRFAAAGDSRRPGAAGARLSTLRPGDFQRGRRPMAQIALGRR